MTENKELFAAMAKAFAAIEGATKDTVNPHFKVKYADLASVVAAIKPALADNGLWFAQFNHEQTGGVCIETIVCHSGGGQMSFGKLFVPAGKQDAQGYGSALTYARRYSLLTAFGVCPDDDDGNAAVAAPAKPNPPLLIDSAQISDLQGMIEGYGLNLGDVLKAFNVPRVCDVPAEHYGAAVKILNKMNNKKQQEQQ